MGTDGFSVWKSAGVGLLFALGYLGFVYLVCLVYVVLFDREFVRV